MSDAPLVSSVGQQDFLQVLQGNGVVLATVAQLVSAPTAGLASADAAIVALTQRVAALEGKPDPCVSLSGVLPLATLQVGTADVAVAVPGLLSTDRVSVEVTADLPLGLTLGALRPSPTTNGVLLVQMIVTVAVSLKTPVALAVTALR